MNDNWKQLNNNLYVERSIQYSIYPGYPKIEFANKLFINSEHKGTNNFDKLIQKIGKTDCKILDLACGSGEFIELLTKYNPNIEAHGITLSLDEVKYARQKGLKYVMPIDMREIQDYYFNNYFDYVTIWCSFQYITHEEKNNVANQIYNLLKQGGCFINVYDQSPAFWEPNNSHWQKSNEFDSTQTQGTVSSFRKK